MLSRDSSRHTVRPSCCPVRNSGWPIQCSFSVVLGSYVSLCFTLSFRELITSPKSDNVVRQRIDRSWSSTRCLPLVSHLGSSGLSRRPSTGPRRPRQVELPRLCRVTRVNWGFNIRTLLGLEGDIVGDLRVLGTVGVSPFFCSGSSK